MNKNKLKSFARESRTRLIDIVSTKLEYVTNPEKIKNEPALKNKLKQIEDLQREIKRTSKDSVIEKVAYTWFNRFIALRFMDANEYTFMKIVTPAAGFTIPEILSEAKRGYIDEKVKVDKDKIKKLLSGQIPAKDPQNEVYQLLLVAVCNYYYSIMPFMFEKINDYTELLLPDDLLSENSILNEIVNNLPAEDCKEVEIIGWLYQYYISEKKDEVINAKKRYKTEEIPAATQLFTPHWIVKYIVDNTIGRMWLEAHPESGIKEKMEFYIEPVDKDKIPPRTISSPEEIKIMDPACGSGHILTYAFELLFSIYEEEGYDKDEIPFIILKNNLFGLEIDDRAANLASFALFMKARDYSRKIFREPVKLNILSLQKIEFTKDEIDAYIREVKPNLFNVNLEETLSLFNYVKDLGSLIRPKIGKVEDILSDLNKKEITENIFYSSTNEKIIKALEQVKYLQGKYDCVVTNPPYVNSTYMNKTVSDFVKANYKETKADLFACFLVRCRALTKVDGMIGYVSPFVWMFISSYRWLRYFMINNTTIQNLIQLEYNAFEPAVVPVCTFTLRNELINIKGDYIKLSDFRGHRNQPIKTLEAIKNSDVKFRFATNQSDYAKIPDSAIAYWASKRILEHFINSKPLKKVSDLRQGMATSDNEKFLRYWIEVSQNKIGYNLNNRKQAQESELKWFPYNKGGKARKWYGNNYFIVNWLDDGKEIKKTVAEKYPYLNGNTDFVVKNQSYYFREGFSWSSLTINDLTARYSPIGFLFDAKGQTLFSDEDLKYLGAFLNTKLASFFLQLIIPTMDYNLGYIGLLPTIIDKSVSGNRINSLSKTNIILCQGEWDSRETSWDFKTNELFRLRESPQLQKAYNNFRSYWTEKFIQLHKNEEELNRIFIEIYGLQDELTPNVELKDITILNDETSIDENNVLVFNQDEIIKQFVSYSVGCMFGRYSLDKEGLVLANQGETLEDYLKQVPKPSFTPDADNIIPILDDDYFMDDITDRFREFLKVSFGEEHFEENLRFVEESIGRDIRSYFQKEFYPDHIKRYKKRPIYWMFSSPGKGFNALIYMHRYKSDTISRLLNEYLREFINKLNARTDHLKSVLLSESVTQKEKKDADKELKKIEKLLKEMHEYEKKILHYAQQKIEIDLDDGVKVNYCKFEEILYPIPGLCK